jgi:hypothetical protein
MFDDIMGHIRGSIRSAVHLAVSADDISELNAVFRRVTNDQVQRALNGVVDAVTGSRRGADPMAYAFEHGILHRDPEVLRLMRPTASVPLEEVIDGAVKGIENRPADMPFFGRSSV